MYILLSLREVLYFLLNSSNSSCVSCSKCNARTKNSEKAQARCSKNSAR